MSQTQDIFGRRALKFGGSFAADSATINVSFDCEDAAGVSPVTALGLLIQQIQIQYQQPITRLYEVGTQFTYYVAGRPQGTANFARVLGPGVVMAELYACLGNVCNAIGNDLCICIQGGCDGESAIDEILAVSAPAMQLGLKNVVMQSLGMTVQAQDMLFNEQMGLFFTALMAQDTCGCQPDELSDVAPACFVTDSSNLDNDHGVVDHTQVGYEVDNCTVRQ